MNDSIYCTHCDCMFKKGYFKNHQQTQKHQKNVLKNTFKGKFTTKEEVIVLIRNKKLRMKFKEIPYWTDHMRELFEWSIKKNSIKVCDHRNQMEAIKAMVERYIGLHERINLICEMTPEIEDRQGFETKIYNGDYEELEERERDKGIIW